MKAESGKSFIVGIGASAGGIAASRELIESIDHLDACFILCQHISPHHESKLTDILQKDTSLSVKTIQHGDKLENRCLFIAPPNTDIEVKDSSFIVTEPPKGPFAKPNISKFFTSLAENSGEQAVAIVLSGTGSDGSEGIAAIRNAGGTVFVQDPASSEYDGMPKASIATHMVDNIASPKNIAQQLKQIMTLDSYTLKNNENDTYQEILQLVSRITNVDFKQYKSGTILRRLQRRMNVKGLNNLESYLEYIQNNTEEVQAFTQDAFIVVSEFWRDPEEFASLKEQVAILIEQLHAPVSLRIWVPGCATGEEAYSISMMLEDLRVDEKLAFDYKIFATDILSKAIDHARIACYTPDKLVKAPEHWKEHYFEFLGDDIYRVRDSIRDRVVFSVHNIFTDPPFSRLNIISCRNLLIYFDSSLQEKIAELFSYSLLPEQSLLFIGKSESITKSGLFQPTTSSERVLTRPSGSVSKVLIPDFRLRKNTEAISLAVRKHEEDQEKFILSALNGAFAPASVIVNDNNQMIYTHGDYWLLMAGKSGVVNMDFFDMINPDYRSECRALVYRSRSSGEVCTGCSHSVIQDGVKFSLQISVRPLIITNQKLTCISYQITPEPQEADLPHESGDMRDSILKMEHELDVTRENLQTVIEELETTNDQLQYYNEELQSTNEEYQSTNEELQTVNEELQSTNEELITINEEYSLKAQEQSKLSSDLTNIQESLDIPFLVINKSFRIQRFTRSCNQLFDTSKIKIHDIVYAVDWLPEFLPQLRDLITTANEQHATQRRNLKYGDETYECQVSPYIDSNNDFDGFTIIFYNTTAFEQAQKDLVFEKIQAQTTLQLVREGVIRLDAGHRIEFINQTALELIESDNDDAIGSEASKRITLKNEQGELVDINNIISSYSKGYDRSDKISQPLMLISKTQSTKYVEISVVPVILDGLANGNIVTLRDVSDKHQQIESLRWQSMHDSLTGLVNRHEMEVRINRCIEASKKNNHESSLLYIDLDQFKVINDTCGHAAGDQLLAQLSIVMGEMLRSRDTLARLGGDEFSILLDRCPVSESEKIAYKIQQKISNYRFIWDNKIFRVGASIGIVSINKDICTVAEVLSDADAACYAAKDQGRNTIQVHSQDNALLELQRSQMRSISDINAAIENDSFILSFHPIREVKNQQISSWEVLLRMHSDDGTMMLPSTFLPAAERFGLINRIDYWVFEHAIKKVSELFNDEAFHRYPELSINLSAHTITNLDYLKFIEQITNQYHYPKNKIWFEITETAAVSNMAKAQRFMISARAQGFKFSLDDFGTGMSSLSYLRELPIDAVKIDMSFLKNITEDSVNREIVRSVREVSHLLDLKVIAEGVESEEQLDCLRTLKIDAFQGFLLGKPMQFDVFSSALLGEGVSS